MKVKIIRNTPTLCISHLALLLLVGLYTPLLWAKHNIIFEGYYKIMASSQHVGFAIIQYGFDDVKKEFTSTYYTKTKLGQGGTTESLQARATNSLKPVSYKYLYQNGKQAKRIDAQFKILKNDSVAMTAQLTDGIKSINLNKKLPKGSFLSTFLTYLMLQNTYKVGTKFNYSAIAEEDGELYSGEVLVKEVESLRQQPVNKMLHAFKGSKFISYTNKKGEHLKTDVPLQKISVVLASSAAEATTGLKLNPKHLKAIFKSIPLGQKNELYKLAQSQSSPSTSEKKSVTQSVQAEPSSHKSDKKEEADQSL